MYAADVNCGFTIHEKNGVVFYTIPAFDAAGFNHCFTTRIGGVSDAPYKSLNLSLSREKSVENKKENYTRVAQSIGCGYEDLAIVNYNHGDGIYHAGKKDAGKGISKQSDLPFCDAMIVYEPGVTGVTLNTDCVPVFVADTKQSIAAVSHAGWRGVLAELPGKVIREFVTVYHSRPEDLIVGIGPHILKCCFEVREDVFEPFMEKFGAPVCLQENGKMYVDLERAVLMQLEKEGVPAANVTTSGLCTCCRDELFFSLRREKDNTGAMGAFIYIGEGR
ncbi:MAG: polyphenol oxidase family protein [Christensenellaceae bacterium]|jgi:YfiH family protein